MVASTRTATEEGRVGSISVRAINDAVEEHEARTQPSTSGRVVEADGYSRRDDRQYHELYDGGNPESWPAGRGIPDYRPLNRNQDTSVRPWGSSAPERVFLLTMFSGILTIGYLNKAWRATFGRVTDSFWKYDVGGDF